MDLQPGTTLSHYRILEAIGAGGMGVVYRAHDERLRRDVALKVLPPGTLSDEPARKRFRQEAFALSQLNHPNIATVHDFDTEGGVDFIVMELVSGPTLQERFEHRPAREDEIVSFGLELCAGLEAAHARGIVHRDLKPANVRFTQDGRLKILDFGLAKLVEGEARNAAGAAATQTESMTATGTPTGTVPYMSPEQLRGLPVDARSDLWSAGLILYELATGRRAFPETRTAPLIASILQDEPAPPHRIRSETTPDLERVILTCLRKDPGQRHASASELGADLRRLQTGATLRTDLHRRRPFPFALVGGIALVLLAGTAAYLGLLRWRAGPAIRSLAVLPLANLSGSADDYFADGMTDELITTLAQIGALKVISRSSVMTYKNAREKLPDIARALHVDAILEGSVARSGNRVRITAQLVHAATDEHLWAKSYERDMRDVLALQSDVARSIAREIRVALTPKERARLESPRAVDPEAHQLYLMGLYAWNKRTTEWLDKAIEYFNQSIAIDPTYALPYAGLAITYAVLPAYDIDRSNDALQKARAASLKALSMDSTLADPHAVLAGVLSEYDLDQKGAEVEFRKALELNPNFAPAHHWYADYLSCMGRHEEALAEIKRAQELDPLSLIIQTEAGGILFRSGQRERGIEALRRTVAMDPGFARSRQTLGMYYRQLGRIEDALTQLQAEDSLLGRARGTTEAATWYGPLRRAFRSGGLHAYYRQLLKQRLELSRKEPVAALGIAVCYSALGERDSAFAWIDRALEQRDPTLLRLKVEPIWDGIRPDPRYAKLVRRLGLES